ncbi:MULTISPECIES: DNA-binding protein [Staphylococcus]|uniref:DNA-binding protein n=1 Tax=Staphylococcus TaxID=1279 RepID=UPI0020A6AABE|nr:MULTISPECIES: DNA-binding protein [Staphylococcus]MDQ7139946.1 DNA-binding protein [Staphylococcus simulans]
MTGSIIKTEFTFGGILKVRKLNKIFAALAISTISITTVTIDTYSNAAQAAPTIGTNQKGEVVFDNSHGQTAGAADWTIDGGFSDYANSITQQGYKVTELRGESNITPQALKGKKILVIPEANIPFKTSEQKAMTDFTQQGGSILFISDHYNADRNLNRIDSSEAMNGYRRGAYSDMTKGMTDGERKSKAMQDVQSTDWLAQTFGVRFRYNALNNLTTSHMLQGKEGLGITDNVKSVTMHAGSTLAITNPDKAKGIVFTPEGLTAKQKWGHAVDEGVYNGGGQAEGPYIAVSKVGKGKAAFIGDSSLVEDSSPKYKREDNGQAKKTYDGFKEADNAQLLKNLTTWLGKSENADSITGLGVSKDKATALKDFEQPENSTEPQQEPWNTPPSHYKWYDRSTFAAGSFGAKENKDDTVKPEQPEDNQEPDGNTSNTKLNSSGVSFELPSNLEAGSTFSVKVTLKHQPKNQTLSNIRLGIYAEGGQQLGIFGENTTPGYSTPQQVKTDSQGNAVLTFEGKTASDFKGDANVRLKQGDTTIKTQPIQIN